MIVAIILGLILSSFLSLTFFVSRHTCKENDLVDLAAAEGIEDEVLTGFLRRKIMAGYLMRGSSHLVSICLLYICIMHFWS